MTVFWSRSSNVLSSLLVSFSVWSNQIGVELVAVGEPRAEQAHAAVDVGEDEAAEVADERLRAGPHRDEVVVGAEVGELRLDEPLLQRRSRCACGACRGGRRG